MCRKSIKRIRSNKKFAYVTIKTKEGLDNSLFTHSKHAIIQAFNLKRRSMISKEFFLKLFLMFLETFLVINLCVFKILAVSISLILNTSHSKMFRFSSEFTLVNEQQPLIFTLQ